MDVDTVAGMSGELAALKLAVIAIIRYSPAREAIAAELRRSTEELVANTLASPFPDLSVQSIQDTIELILRHAESS